MCVARAPSLLLVPLLLLVGTDAQKLSLGPCPNIQPVQNFNATAYSGLWYENRKFQNVFELGQKCITARYSGDLGGFISVQNSGFLPPFYKQIRAYGFGYLTHGGQTGALAVGFPEPVDRSQPNYMVIEIDYSKYSVVYSCKNVAAGITHIELLWILTRKPRFPKRYVNDIVARLTKRGVLKAFLMTPTDQLFCPGRNLADDEDFV